ncbi:related to RNA-binding protein (RRM superfamily) [Ustilago trichophora]|uniref:Related to RNA-binding protein (RRM superfamily) n=1 Tax=Ustilago trichophora TaxID=86804 RepID=A0A5C3E598_9BASI|nr:related to RNA-binding protein (RRM superfamily) [Ustilago trichophora]
MASHTSVGAARQHSRILFVKNLNYTTTGADLYQVFGRYGAIRQIRLGDGPKTKGTAYVVFEEMADAKRASDNLNGFHLNERYIVVLYHMPARLAAKADLARREAELAELKALHNIVDEA